ERRAHGGAGADTHRGPKRAAPGEPLHREDPFGKFADRDQRPVHRDRPYRDIDPRTIGKTRVDHRRGFVDTTADTGNDLVDDAQQVRLILEMHLGRLQLSKSLDKTHLVGIDQNVGDGRVLEQRFDRAVPGHLIHNLVREQFELALIEGNSLGLYVVRHIATNLPLQLLWRQLLQYAEVELVDDLLMQPQFFIEQRRTLRKQLAVRLVCARRRGSR